MITCKICEKEVPDDKLGLHSQKCREVAEHKDSLLSIVATMENHGDKALYMKNSLETHAARQQKLQNKNPSFKDLCDTPDSSRPRSWSGSQTSTSPRKIQTPRKSEGGYINSEEKKEDQTPSTRLATELSEEPINRMSKEEYEKFVEEVKKCMIVLKKVILYTKSIAKWALEHTTVCDVNHTAHAELEVDEKEIRDENVLKFLSTFNKDLKTYLKIRRKYLEAVLDLSRINSSKTTKLKILPKRSVSSTTPNDINNLRSSTNLKKLDSATLMGIEKEAESPVIEKRKLNSSKLTPIEVGLGSPLRLSPTKLTPIEVGLGTPLSIKKPSVKPVLQEPSTGVTVDSFKSPTNMKGLKLDFNSPLFQNNMNHQISGLSKFFNMAGTKKNLEDSSILREKIKSTININEKSLEIAKIGPMSPNTSMQTKKSDAKVQKVREALNILNADFPTKGFNNKGKTDGKMAKDQLKALTSNTPQATKAFSWFKTLRNEDSSVLEKFSSQQSQHSQHSNTKNSNNTSNSGGLSSNSSNEWSSQKFLSDEPKIIGSSTPKTKCKKLDENKEEFVDSLKGYYSDCNASKPHRRISKTAFGDAHFDDFEIIKLIGKGAYGNVWLVKKKTTGDYYAMKTVDWVDKNTHNRIKALKAEKDIYEALKGDFFVKAFWTFEYENLICFVTEYMPGGDFSKILDEFSRLDEEYAKFYFAELVQALESLHDLGVVHRDLKPENMLIDPKGHVRLTDFGLSQKGMDMLKDSSSPNNLGVKKIQSPTQTGGNDDKLLQTRMNTLKKFCRSSTVGLGIDIKKDTEASKTVEKIFYFLGKEEDQQKIFDKKSLVKKSRKESSSQDKKPKMVGTPDYMAPEIIAPEKYDLEKYNEKCMDWWSMGAILYQILVGIPPFCDETIQKVFQNIREYKIEWPDIGDGEDCISEVAADLIKKLLNPDPKKRLGANGAEEVKKHPFFKGINWGNLRNTKAPIIPCSPEYVKPDESLSINPQPKNNNESSKPAIPLITANIKRSNTRNKIFDIEIFKMRRVDLLDQANQQAHQDLVNRKKKES